MKKNPCSGRCMDCPYEKNCGLMPLNEWQRYALMILSLAIMGGGFCFLVWGVVTFIQYIAKLLG